MAYHQYEYRNKNEFLHITYNNIPNVPDVPAQTFFNIDCENNKKIMDTETFSFYNPVYNPA